MAKIIIFIALVSCCFLYTTSAAFRESGWNSNGGGGGGAVQWLSYLCNNQTLAQSLVNQIQQFLTNLATNNSYAEILSEHNQAIAYIQSGTNTAVLSSNCTGYFNGLNNALKLDETAQKQQEKYAENANRQLMQIIQSVIGYRGLNFENFLK
jgi:hypothetical protein